jgi:hypothetical protein
VLVRFRDEVAEKWFFEMVFLMKGRKYYRKRGLRGGSSRGAGSAEGNEWHLRLGICLPLTSFGKLRTGTKG